MTMLTTPLHRPLLDYATLGARSPRTGRRKRLSRAAVAMAMPLLLAAALPAQAAPTVGGAAQWQNAGNGVTAPLVLRTGDFSPVGAVTGATGLNLSAGFTAMFWARPDAVMGAFGGLFTLSSTNDAIWTLYTAPSSLNLWQSFENSAGEPLSLSTPTALTLQQWTLVTVVANNSNNSLRIYLGDQLTAQAVGPDLTLATAPGTLIYGTPYTAAAQVTMGDFGLWNNPLSQLQVSSLLTAQPSSPVPEVSTAVLLLAGLSGLGLLTARRRRAGVAERPAALSP